LTGPSGVTVVTGAQVVDNSLFSADLGANSVGQSEIQTNGVASAEVQDNSLTANDLAPNSVGSSELVDLPLVCTNSGTTTVNAPAGSGVVAGSATCPSGYTVVGGICNTSSNRLVNYQSKMIGSNSWNCQHYNISNISGAGDAAGQIFVQARCCKLP
jgi:hypothetical protein